MTRNVAAVQITADPVLVVQALANVIRNAIQAIAESHSPRREVQLSAQTRRVRCPGGENASRIVLGVQDTGPGIPADVLDRVFNPFFTTRATGTGLGLAIVHRIIDAHGGHIVIQNVAPCGTRVELCLPVDVVARSKTSSAVLNPKSKIQNPKSELLHESDSRR